MDRTAFVFPGRGSQRVGMGAGLAGRHPDLVDAYYRQADTRLGFPLSELCWQGPGHVLRDASVSEPAVLLTSVVTLEVLRRSGLRPDVVAGHGLGEYTALVAAGSLHWTDALRLVRLRGQLTSLVTERAPGATLDVAGVPTARLVSLCARITAGSGRLVEVTADNAADRAVVEGDTAAVAQLGRAVAAVGGRAAAPRHTGVPRHRGLMRAVQAEFGEALAATEFQDPVLPFVSSVTAEPVTDAGGAADGLRRQFTGRVEWTATVRRLRYAGATRYVEVGPGRSLAGHCRRTDPAAATHTSHDTAAVDRTVDAFDLAAGAV